MVMKNYTFICKECHRDLGDEKFEDDIRDRQKRCEYCWIWNKPEMIEDC